MHQSLRGFVAERVNRKESVPESLNAGLEEALDLVIQIEKPDAHKLPHFFTDRRFSDTTDACQKYAHLYTLSVVFLLSERHASPIDFQINNFTALSVKILDDVHISTTYSDFSF